MVTVKETLRAHGKYAVKDVKYRIDNVREELARAELAVADARDIFYGKSGVLPADIAQRVGEIGAKTLGINDFRKDADELEIAVGNLRNYVDCVEKMLTDAERLLDVEYDEWKDNSRATTRRYAGKLKNSADKRDGILEKTSGMIYKFNALYRSLWQVEDMSDWKTDERDAIRAARERMAAGERTMDDVHYVVRSLGSAVDRAVELFDWRWD